MPRLTVSSNRLSLLQTLIGLAVIIASCNRNVSATRFVDSSSLKPSIILILPQSFNVPIDTAEDVRINKLQQYVAVINNFRNTREDQLLRQQYKKLSLQVRDAKSPVTGQLFYEHIFDYFPEGQSQHLVPIVLDQVSPSNVQLERSTTQSNPGSLSKDEPNVTVTRPQHVIVSIRPHQIDSGFGSDSIEFVSSIPVPVVAVPSSDGRRSFAVVQTDKPIYKPEDKVRIRSLVVNENLRPVIDDEIRLQVKNPHKIVVEEVRFPNSNSSNPGSSGNTSIYFDHVFTFPPEPMLGVWSIHLLHSDPIANDTTSFEVKEYSLPTYDIVFESPKYILPSTQTISGSITTKYHYGKPVQGKVQFKYGYKESGLASPKFIARSSIKNVDPETGRVDYKINTDKFKETEWFPGISGFRLVVEATVTEMTTGHREVATDASCIFMSLPYRLSFDNSIEYFKPGLSQPLSVRLLEMQTQTPARAGIQLLAQYRDQNGTILGKTLSPGKNQSVDFTTKLEFEAFTDSTGRATFMIGPIRDDITSIQATIRWINSTNHYDARDQTRVGSKSPDQIHMNELAVGHHLLMRQESHNGWISLMNKSMTHLRVGEDFVSDLLIRDAVVIPKKIFYIIVARGQIIALDLLNSDGLVKFKTTEAMIPAIRIVLFALAHDSTRLISDSMLLNVGEDLDCGLAVSYNSGSENGERTTLLRPSDKGKLAIEARHGDIVSLIGVDAAVYTLNNRSRFNPSRIIERIRKLDLGCGFGGGKDSLDVFHNAGLMFFDGLPNDSLAEARLGSSCLTIVNQLKHIEDLQLGYARPMFSAAAQQNRPRTLDLAAAVRQKMTSSSSRSRSKREVDVDSILRRYRDPIHRSCCRLGTLEDLPQRRNCSVRARIVEKYMRQSDFRSCSMIYFDCCRTIFGEQLLLSSILSGRDQVEPVVETRVIHSQQAPQYSEAVILPSIGHLDQIESQTLIRKDFRETWLFEMVNVENGDGTAVLDVKLPHSITSWLISALALNMHQPMCVMSQPLKLVTFQEIFLQVSMPYKVIQGEQIDLVATIFNYSPTTQEVVVYIYGVENVCSEAEPGERSERKRLRIEKNASQSILFPMIPLKTGSYPIRMVAIATGVGSSDVVERLLKVVPRGKTVVDETTFSLDPLNQQRRSKRAIQTGNLVDEIDSSKGLQRSKVRLSPTRDPEYIVPQTQECIVTAIGDKLGQSVQTTMIDVENLIRLPHGCGEQVMIYLGPTLYTARYLSSINRLTGDSRWRAIRYIQSGYKRILNYRKENGAFSAFARRDPSIWLTAFIAKMLCQTERTPFIAEEIHVDKTIVNSALSWLIENQNNDTGCWTELNPVYHREMLGGVLKENALTAFVTLSLNECSHHSPDLIEEVKIPTVKRSTSSAHTNSNGIDRLRISTQKAEQALMDTRFKAVKERNPYVLALTSYSLSFSRPKDAAAIFNDLMILAERSSSRNQLFWRGDYQIETAAYALQALIELAPILSQPSFAQSILNSRPAWSPGSDAVSIVNWLSSRKSYTGAFESTQDTVVALEALSKFAQLQSNPRSSSLMPQSTPSPSPTLTCNVMVNNRTRRSIEFGKDNSQILQTFRLDPLDMESTNGDIIDIVTSGNGLGTMSVKLKYNVFQEEDELCRFNIDSSIEEWHPKIKPGSSKESYQMMSLGDVNDTKEVQSNDTIEDDYFKTFDKSMLSELNLVDPDLVGLKLNQESTSMRKETLRVRRDAPKTMDLSANNNRPNNESWTTKVVSVIRSKLPAWITPKSTTVSPLAPNQDSASENEPRRSDSATRRNNTSRRSTQASTVPLISHPSGIPAEAKLNSLSNQLELGQNDTNHSAGGGQYARQVLDQLTNRLVLLLRVCVYHMSSRRDSEMAVIEVGILSGFKPNEADLKEIMNDVGTPAMKYEISPDRSLVVIYMQYIPFSGPFCLQFRLIRDSLVYNLQSGYIRVYEYYSPTHSCSDFYTPTRLTNLLETKCDLSGQVCQCAAKSLCPATTKLLELGEIHSVNATKARNQLIDLVCSDRYDLVSLVRLKSVRYQEAAKMFKLAVKVKSDLKGNLTKIIDLQRQQKNYMTNNIRKQQHVHHNTLAESSIDGSTLVDTSVDEEDTSLDYLHLNIDSGCVRDDPFLLHLAHPNQWKQGGELMILFGQSGGLERRYFKTTPKLSSSQIMVSLPRPKPHILSSRVSSIQPRSSSPNDKALEVQVAAAALVEDAQQLQYSTAMLLDKSSILYDLAYQAKVQPRETINNLVLWLDLRSRREKWTCS